MPENLINETNIITRIEEELPKSTLYWFFISLLAAVFWTIYITYYNSRVIGLIATLIINKFVKYGRVNVGEYIFYLFGLTLVLLNLDLSIYKTLKFSLSGQDPHCYHFASEYMLKLESGKFFFCVCLCVLSSNILFLLFSIFEARFISPLISRHFQKYIHFQKCIQPYIQILNIHK